MCKLIYESPQNVLLWKDNNVLFFFFKFLKICKTNLFSFVFFFLLFYFLWFSSKEIQLIEECKQMNSETYQQYHKANTSASEGFQDSYFTLCDFIGIQPTLKESRKCHVTISIVLVCELKRKLTSCRIKECKLHSS